MIVFKTKPRYKLELLLEETMKLLGSSKKEISKYRDGELIPKLEDADAVSIHCNLVNNTHQQVSKVLFTFGPNKQFGQLITIEPQSLTLLKTTNAESFFIEVWFTIQNNIPLKIEDNVNATLIIGTSYGNKLL